MLLINTVHNDEYLTLNICQPTFAKTHLSQILFTTNIVIIGLVLHQSVGNIIINESTGETNSKQLGKINKLPMQVFI